jgi:probable addiction module antidote protein
METSKFDIADYLDSSEMIAEYLNTALEKGNDTEIVTATGNVAKAIGMINIAEQN